MKEKILFPLNTLFSLFMTTKFNKVLLFALAPEGCRNLFCSLSLGALLPMSAVVFFNLLHSLGFIAIYHANKIFEPKPVHNTLPISTNSRRLILVLKNIGIITLRQIDVTIFLIFFLIGLIFDKKILSKK